MEAACGRANAPATSARNRVEATSREDESKECKKRADECTEAGVRASGSELQLSEVLIFGCQTNVRSSRYCPAVVYLTCNPPVLCFWLKVCDMNLQTLLYLLFHAESEMGFQKEFAFIEWEIVVSLEYVLCS